MPLRSYPEVDPRELTRDSYDQARNKMVTLLSKNPGVQSVYGFGAVSAVGVSDIDLLIVIDADKKVAQQVLELYEHRLTSTEQFMLYQHDPMIVGADFVEQLDYVRPVSNLEHLSGERYEFKEIDDALVKLYILVDLLTHYYPMTLRARDREVRVRHQHINATRFISSLAGDVAVALGAAKILSRSMGAIDRTVRENDQLRRTLRDDAQVLAWLDHAEDVLVCEIRDLAGGLNAMIGTKLAIEDHVRAMPHLKRDRLFLPGANTRTYSTLQQVLLSAKVKVQPLFFYAFFMPSLPGPIRAAVNERNAVLDRYCTFVQRTTQGRNLYYPWWRSRPTVRGSGT